MGGCYMGVALLRELPFRWAWLPLTAAHWSNRMAPLARRIQYKIFFANFYHINRPKRKEATGAFQLQVRVTVGTPDSGSFQRCKLVCSWSTYNEKRQGDLLGWGHWWGIELLWFSFANRQQCSRRAGVDKEQCIMMIINMYLFTRDHYRGMEHNFSVMCCATCCCVLMMIIIVIIVSSSTNVERCITVCIHSAATQLRDRPTGKISESKENGVRKEDYNSSACKHSCCSAGKHKSPVFNEKRVNNTLSKIFKDTFQLDFTKRRDWWTNGVRYDGICTCRKRKIWSVCS